MILVIANNGDEPLKDYLCQAKNFASIKLSSNCQELQVYYRPIFNLHTFILISFQYCNRPICKFSCVAPQLVADAKLNRIYKKLKVHFIYSDDVFITEACGVDYIYI